MEYANKGNKQYPILGEADRKSFLADGFDIINEKGELVEHSPRKTVPYNEFAELECENKALTKENAELKEAVEKGNPDTAKLTKELADLKKENAELKKKVAELTKE